MEIWYYSRKYVKIMEGKSLVSRVVDGVKTLFKKDDASKAVMCENQTLKVQKPAQKSFRIESIEDLTMPESALRHITRSYNNVEIGSISKLIYNLFVSDSIIDIIF